MAMALDNGNTMVESTDSVEKNWTSNELKNLLSFYEHRSQNDQQLDYFDDTENAPIETPMNFTATIGIK